MSLYQNFREKLVDSMRAKDTVRTNVIKGLLAGFTNELVATNRKPQEELPDEDILAVIRRQVKQRKDSIEQYREGGREELAQEEEAELKILEEYLPKMMSKEEIEKMVDKKMAEMGPVDKSKMGPFMGAVMKELKGKADGAEVKAVIESKLG